MANVARILFADDDMEDRLIIEDAFKEIGLQDVIAFVEDGELVLRYLENLGQHDVFPQLIVLDLNMPRLNGKETLRMLKTHDDYRHIPVKIFSTSMNDIEKEQCMQLGADDYIIKPVKYDQCIAVAKSFYEFSCALQ